jgi:hypothetical protein
MGWGEGTLWKKRTHLRHGCSEFFSVVREGTNMGGVEEYLVVDEWRGIEEEEGPLRPLYIPLRTGLLISALYSGPTFGQLKPFAAGLVRLSGKNNSENSGIFE